MKLNLTIDKNALDEEWVSQAEQMHYWCSVRADAQRAMDYAKDAVAVCEADVGNDARSHPEKYGIAKMTIDTVAAAVAASALREQAYQAWVEAKHAVGVADAAVQALEHRKRGLTCLTDLHLAGYFAGVGANRGTGRARGVRQEDESDTDE